MHSTFRIWLALCLLLAIILLSICQPADAAGRYDSELRTKRQIGKKACDCRYASDSPVCASNGVTYPSMCRFDCAKQKVKRLRVVSNGSCRGKSLADYRRGQKGKN